MRICGSLWSVPADDQARALARAAEAGLTRVHWDSSDGQFATPGGFSSDDALSLLDKVGDMESEAHLMVNEPLQHIDAWADFCTTIAIPIEISDPWPSLRRIEARGARPAFAVSLETPLAHIPHGSFDVLAMAIPPGQAGSSFDPRAVDRVADLLGRRCHESIGVDGGVGPEQFTSLGLAGANWIVSGSSLFAAYDIGTWIDRCQRDFSR
jgi:ribulose-phosphate 3-epimerase